MQPAIKMALRVARQGADYLKAHFERQDANTRDDAERHQQLERVEKSIYDNFTEQLEKAYKDHTIVPMGHAILLRAAMQECITTMKEWYRDSSFRQSSGVGG